MKIKMKIYNTVQNSGTVMHFLDHQKFELSNNLNYQVQYCGLCIDFEVHGVLCNSYLY